MRRILLSLVAAIAFAGAVSAADDPKPGSDAKIDQGPFQGILIDNSCGKKEMPKDNPEASAANHPKSCAIKCAKSGYALIAGKTMLPFDDNGNKLATEYLADKDTNTKVIVEGQIADGKIAVTAIKQLEPPKDPSKKE